MERCPSDREVSKMTDVTRYAPPDTHSAVSAAGAVVPHAPVLLPEVNPAAVKAARPYLAAIGSLDWGPAQVVVVVSPHGARTGVYERVAGSLDDFGVRDMGGEWPTATEELAGLARSWGSDVLEGPIDHGVFVPLALGCAHGLPVIAVALAEGPHSLSGGPFGYAEKLAQAVSGLGASAVFIASAHTSAALSPRAPVTGLVLARATEQEALESLRGDAGSLCTTVGKLLTLGGTCSAGSLTAFGHRFGGRTTDVLAYGCPFGVGYLVASVGAS